MGQVRSCRWVRDYAPHLTASYILIPNEDVYVGGVRGAVTALELIPASVRNNNAAEAAGFWR